MRDAAALPTPKQPPRHGLRPLLLLTVCTAAWTSTAAAPPADALADQLCALGPALAQPAPTPMAGCSEAVCTAAGDQQLCACKTGKSWQYQHRRAQQVVQRWPTAVSPMTGPAAFELRQASIAADGQPRWLVARWLGVSNGLGISRHELCVLNPALSPTGPATAPSCRVVQDWQALSLLVQEPGQKACGLMDSAWQSGHEPGTSTSTGTYAVGRLWRWQGEHWQAVPSTQRQAVARRLLPAFMAQREDLPLVQSSAGTLWYQHASAQAAVCPGPLCPRPAPAR